MFSRLALRRRGVARRIAARGAVDRGDRSRHDRVQMARPRNCLRMQGLKLYVAALGLSIGRSAHESVVA